MQLPSLIEKYAENPENKTAYYFEDILTDAFNLFINVEANKLGGPSRTDIECLYLDDVNNNKIFAVDAKATHKKLTSLSSGRLKGHRQQIGALYTIIITPRYVPGVLQDINGESIVIIKASTFSEYLYNYIYANNRNIDYQDIHEIILSNLGTDISGFVEELSFDKFASANK